MGQGKWTTANHIKVWFSYKEGDVVYMVWLEVSPLLRAPSRETSIYSSKYHSQSDQLKAEINENHLEWVNRKHIIFHQYNTRSHVSLMTRQKLSQLVWEGLIHPPHFSDTAPMDLHLFWFYKIILMERKFQFPGRLWKATIFCSKDKNLVRWNYTWKMTEGSGIKWWIHCLIKFLVKVKNVSFIFT